MPKFVFDLTSKGTSFLLTQYLLSLCIIVLDTHTDVRDLTVRKAYETLPQWA